MSLEKQAKLIELFSSCLLTLNPLLLLASFSFLFSSWWFSSKKFREDPFNGAWAAGSLPLSLFSWVKKIIPFFGLTKGINPLLLSLHVGDNIMFLFRSCSSFPPHLSTCQVCRLYVADCPYFAAAKLTDATTKCQHFSSKMISLHMFH